MSISAFVVMLIAASPTTFFVSSAAIPLFVVAEVGGRDHHRLSESTCLHGWNRRLRGRNNRAASGPCEATRRELDVSMSVEGRGPVRFFGRRARRHSSR
jgi:hypothetical protein